jgi:phage tail protein X
MARASQAAGIAAIQAVLPTAGTWFATLSNTDPGTAGVTELPGITRQTYTASAGTAAIPSVVSNTNAITIPNTGATAANYLEIYDALTAGNYRIGAALASAVTAASMTFAVGAAQFSAS